MGKSITLDEAISKKVFRKFEKQLYGLSDNLDKLQIRMLAKELDTILGERKNTLNHLGIHYGKNNEVVRRLGGDYQRWKEYDMAHYELRLSNLDEPDISRGQAEYLVVTDMVK